MTFCILCLDRSLELINHKLAGNFVFGDVIGGGYCNVVLVPRDFRKR